MASSLKIHIDGDTSGFEKSINSLAGMAQKTLAGYNSFALGIAKGIGAAFTAAGGALLTLGGLAVKEGMGFETQMSAVQAISGASAKDMELLSQKAKDMGAKTVFSATEAGKAMEYMGMAGWDSSQMVDGLAGIMNAAAASGEDLGLVSDIITDGLTAFGMSAEDSGRMADVLAAAATKSNTNIGMLGDSFKYVAPVAGALGYSLEDTSVALGLMANSGIKASEAGTSLRALLANLAKPSDPVSAYMERLGISLSDVSGNILPLNTLLGDLREKFQGLSEAEQAEYAAGLAGREGMSGLLAIVRASPEEYEKLSEAINNSSGAAEAMAEVRLDNLAGDIEQLGGALSTLAIEWSESINGPAREAVQFAEEQVQKLISAFKSDGLKGAVSEIGNILSETVTKLTEEAPALVEMVTGLISSLVSGLLENKDALLQGATETFHALLEGVETILPQLLELAATFTPSIADALMQGSGAVYTAGIEILTSLFEGLASNAEGLGETAGSVMKDFAEALLENLPKLMEAAIEIISGLGKGIGEQLPELIPVAIEAILALAEALVDNASSLTEAAIAIIEGLIEGLIEALPTLLEEAPKLIGKLADALVKDTKSLVNSGVKLIAALTKALIDNLPEILEAALKITAELVRGLLSSLFEIGGAGVKLGGELIKKILETDWLQLGKDILAGIVRGLEAGLNAALETAKSICGSIFDAFTTFFNINSPSRLMRDKVGHGVIEGVAVGMDDRAAKNLIEDSVDDISEKTFDTFSNGLTGSGSKLKTSLLSAFSRLQPEFTASVSATGFQLFNGVMASGSADRSMADTFNIIVNIHEASTSGVDVRQIARQIGKETQNEMRRRGIRG